MKPNGSAIYHTIKRPSIQKSNRHGMINRNKDNQPVGDEGIQTELRSILKEIRVITNKIRAEVESTFYIRHSIFLYDNIFTNISLFLKLYQYYHFPGRSIDIGEWMEVCGNGSRSSLLNHIYLIYRATLSGSAFSSPSCHCLVNVVPRRWQLDEHNYSEMAIKIDDQWLGHT